MLVRLRFLLCLAAITWLGAYAANNDREFRGAWLHTVYQSQYKQLGTEGAKKYLISQLDSLQAMGVNAILFQVRPQSDAFYKSDLEPWSRFLTDNGKAPAPYWDPLEFMVEQAHARGMELHAWLNPYRVTSSPKQTLPAGHIYHKHPERFVRYDGKLYFNPAVPENREFIGKVVEDIVSRYDIDAIHFDDYFYPYPVAGKEFPDRKEYTKYGKGMDKGDWRRKNVDLLIEDLNKRIKKIKPWVRFGISPFGIYRNKKTDPKGSDTNGLENYDSLYADVLLWQRNGWIDYLLPQLYWELDHKAASYRVLVDWWNNASDPSRYLFIGQDVARTMSKNELSTKIDLARKGNNIAGNCWWPGYSLTKNTGGVADSLACNYQASLVLPPAYPWLSEKAPSAPTKVEISGKKISWKAPAVKNKANDAVLFAIYRFDNKKDYADNKGDTLVAVSSAKTFTATKPGIYAIASVDRVNNTSTLSDPVTVK